MRNPNHINSWQIINWGTVTNISEEKIRYIVKLKEKKFNLYQKSTHTNWLLIASDSRNPSAMIEVSEKLNFNIDSKFEKIFFLTYPKIKAYCIK